jgi:hypothetical protein
MLKDLIYAVAVQGSLLIYCLPRGFLNWFYCLKANFKVLMLYPVSRFTFYSFLILFPINELNESTICEKSLFIRFLGISVNDSIIQIMITSIIGKHSHSRQVTQPMFKRVFPFLS